jgi:hypothetical protein
MPEQQVADLQILGQLQSQLQLESDSLSRAEQQKSYLQSSMMASASAPVVDLDEEKPIEVKKPGPKSKLAIHREQLAKLLTIFTDKYPQVVMLKKQIEVEEALEAVQTPTTAAVDVSPKSLVPAAVPPSQGLLDISSKPSEHAGADLSAIPNPAQPNVRRPRPPVRYFNPVLESQLKVIDAEITKHKEERQRLSKVISGYQSKLEAIPIREQEITDLVRDYETSKAHYSQLLEKQLSADTATQLEIRQKGERFTILDPAQPAERPSRPNRALINGVGSLGGLGLGLLLALFSELLGASITSPEQITAATGLPVLEVIPIIQTHSDKIIRKRRSAWAAAVAVASLVVGIAVLLYYYRTQFL